MRKLRTTYDEVVMGWRCVHKLYRFKMYSVGDQVFPVAIYNCHDERLNYTEALGWWWVEEHILREDRELKKAMEEAFSASNGGVERIRMEKSGRVGIGNPNTIKFGPNVALVPDHGTLVLNQGTMTITHPDPLGTWEFFGIHVQSNRSPNPLQKLFSYLLLGAKWMPRYKQPWKEPETYLRLMLDMNVYRDGKQTPTPFSFSTGSTTPSMAPTPQPISYQDVWRSYTQSSTNSPRP